MKYKISIFTLILIYPLSITPSQQPLVTYQPPITNIVSVNNGATVSQSPSFLTNFLNGSEVVAKSIAVLALIVDISRCDLSRFDLPATVIDGSLLVGGIVTDKVLGTRIQTITSAIAFARTAQRLNR